VGLQCTYGSNQFQPRAYSLRRSAIALSNARRCPTTDTPKSFKSSAVRLGRSFSVIALSRKAASYCSRPRLRSHTAKSKSTTAPSFVEHIINRERRVVYRVVADCLSRATTRSRPFGGRRRRMPSGLRISVEPEPHFCLHLLLRRAFHCDEPHASGVLLTDGKVVLGVIPEGRLRLHVLGLSDDYPVLCRSADKTLGFTTTR
jgi:hypothetical protein